MKIIIILFLSSLSIIVSGQDIVGLWETYDDKTNEKKSVIEIYQVEDVYYAKIVDTYLDDKKATCLKCKGLKKGKALIGLVIIEELKGKGKKYSGGSILDPESGNTYKCNLELLDSAKLKVRGFLGMSLFGRTQYWRRK